MRVVSGRARGRGIYVPAGSVVRPTGDRVREAVFDMLASLGGVEGASILDLFAGTGAMGIEALSRSAGSATFVDIHLLAVEAVRRNLAATGLAGTRVRVVRADVLRYLHHAPPVDLAFADPPYAYRHWPELLGRLRAATAVLESDRALDLGGSWEVIRVKRYGGTVVTLACSSAGLTLGRTSGRLR